MASFLDVDAPRCLDSTGMRAAHSGSAVVVGRAVSRAMVDPPARDLSRAVEDTIVIASNGENRSVRDARHSGWGVVQMSFLSTYLTLFVMAPAQDLPRAMEGAAVGKAGIH